MYYVSFRSRDRLGVQASKRVERKKPVRPSLPERVSTRRGEAFRESYELTQLWEFGDRFIKELYLEDSQFGCINSGNKVFHVLEIAFKVKISESRKDSARCWRSRSLAGIMGSVGSETYGSIIKMGRCRQTSDYSLGWNVAIDRDIREEKVAKVVGRQKEIAYCPKCDALQAEQFETWRRFS